MIPNARFVELLSDIEPSSTTTRDSAEAHSSVRSFLEGHDDFKERVEWTFLAGSYARNTAIRPKKASDGYERPDVDIIVVTNYDTEEHPDDVLNEIGGVLGEKYTVERINKRSVRVVTSKAEIDVVPVVEEGMCFKIPDRDLEAWKDTNPPKHNEWSAEKNEAYGGRFKPLVKLFKWWRRENRTGKRPKGFVLEVLVSMHAPSGVTHYGEAFAQLLEGIRDSYSNLAEAGEKPFISDPGLPGNDILSKVSITDWKNFMTRIRSHAGHARRAQDEEDVEESTRLWRILFGSRFRSTAKAAVAQSVASAFVAPAPSYTFPDAPAAPKKPRGFA